MRRALVVCVVLAGCGAPVDESASALVNGAADPGDPAVVAVVARRTHCDQPNPTVMCTGTLIAPRVVLTAAHCLTLPDSAGSYEVLVGSRLDDPQGRFIVVSDVHKDPQYTTTSTDHDVALLRLTDPASAAPVPLRTAPLDATLVGQTVRTVGFGATSPGTVPDGVKRQGTIGVTAVEAATFTAQPPQVAVCRGDTGAPALLINAGVEELAGVFASADAACAQQDVAVRADGLGAFVQPYLDATDATATGFGAAAFTADRICSSMCATSADCPGALGCIVEADVNGQCQLSGLGWGDFTTACQTDAECGAGGQCARLTPDECRCFQACNTRPPTPKGCGCAVAARSPSGLTLALLAGLGAFALRRRRGRTRA